MANELARLDGGVMVRDEWTDDRVALVKTMYCKGASETEFEVFVETCKRTGLSPLAKQIYCIMRKNQGQLQMTIQVGIDGFRLIADRTGRYVPGREATYTYDEKGNLTTATAYVKKLAGGEWHEVPATVRWDEFHGDSSFWREMPHHQLGKVAEAHALRRAFPADLSGLYTNDEMEQADRQPAPVSHGARVSEPRPAALPPAEVMPSERPAPAPRPAPAARPEPSERDRLKLEYGRLAFRAQQLKVKVTPLQSAMTVDEIRDMILIAEAQITDAAEQQPAEEVPA